MTLTFRLFIFQFVSGEIASAVCGLKDVRYMFNTLTFRLLNEAVGGVVTVPNEVRIYNLPIAYDKVRCPLSSSSLVNRL